MSMTVKKALSHSKAAHRKNAASAAPVNWIANSPGMTRIWKLIWTLYVKLLAVEVERESSGMRVVNVEINDVATDVANVEMEYAAPWVVPVERDEKVTFEGKLK